MEGLSTGPEGVEKEFTTVPQREQTEIDKYTVRRSLARSVGV